MQNEIEKEIILERKIKTLRGWVYYIDSGLPAAHCVVDFLLIGNISEMLCKKYNKEEIDQDKFDFFLYFVFYVIIAFIHAHIHTHIVGYISMTYYFYYCYSIF